MSLDTVLTEDRDKLVCLALSEVIRDGRRAAPYRERHKET